MGILDTAARPDNKPCIITLTGDPGVGKSTLAATFPKPIFMLFDDGLQAIPADKRPFALPLVETVEQAIEQLNALLVEEHDFKTLVIDDVSTADRMFTEHIIKSDPNPKVNSLNQAAGGYGAGKGVLAAMHGRVRKAAGLLRDRRGMNVIFIAHAETIRVEPPNEEAYTSYALRLNEKSMPHYVDNVDLVGYMKLETIVVGEDGERKKAISDGTRKLITYLTAENVSKNRYGITEKLTVKPGENPLVDYIPALQVAGGNKKETKQ